MLHASLRKLFISLGITVTLLFFVSVEYHTAYAAVSVTSIWAGYEADGPPNTYTMASLQFTIPTVTEPENGHADTWIGLGDGLTDGPKVLVQAGVDSWIQDGQQVNTPWWAVVPTSPSSQNPVIPDQELSIHIRTGDTVYVAIKSNYRGDGKDIFFMKDITSHTSAYHMLQSPLYLSEGSSAECIVERPAIGSATPLGEFNPSTHRLLIQNCGAGTNTVMRCIGKVEHHLVTMENGSTLLASAGPITTNGCNFPVYWHNSL